TLIATFREVAAMDLGDGIVFDTASVRASAIREDDTYGGTRINLLARLGSGQQPHEGLLRFGGHCQKNSVGWQDFVRGHRGHICSTRYAVAG
ncbi:MAG: hypothetical protein V4609_03735, partial [Pseudomonadota bacterium]